GATACPPGGPVTPEPLPTVSDWLARLQAGHASAVGPLFERYYRRLARQADALLPGGPVSGDDVAASAFKSFWRGVTAGQFPQLAGRDELWRLLVGIVRHKAADQHRRQCARKRGGG